MGERLHKAPVNIQIQWRAANAIAIQNGISIINYLDSKINHTAVTRTDIFTIILYNIYEPRRDKTCLREFPTRPDNKPACAATEAS